MVLALLWAAPLLLQAGSSLCECLATACLVTVAVVAVAAVAAAAAGGGRRSASGASAAASPSTTSSSSTRAASSEEVKVAIVWVIGLNCLGKLVSRHCQICTNRWGKVQQLPLPLLGGV